jgi:diguanylate cyclase (GGDEF)-like protein
LLFLTSTRAKLIVNRHFRYVLVSLILGALIFAFDYITPRGVATGMLYTAVVLIGLVARSSTTVWLFAVFGTGLAIGGYFLSPVPLAPVETAFINRVLAICAIWLTAVLSYLYLALQPLAERDQLTGAYNRHYLFERARGQIEMGRRYQMPLSLILLDIDHFKDINDTYGHSAGDHVLKHLAHLLQQHTRLVDTVCRYGGEEFVVLLPMVALEGALTTARRVQQALAQNPLRWGTTTLTPTVSIGIAEWQEGYEGIEPLIAEADKALYEAKASGRNRIIAAPVPAERPA